MITITATRNDSGKLWRVNGMNSGDMHAEYWVWLDSTPPVSDSAEVDGSFFLQGSEDQGALRDNSCQHRKTAGEINLSLGTTPTLYIGDLFNRIGYNGVYYYAQGFGPASVGNTFSRSYPLRRTNIPSYSYYLDDCSPRLMSGSFRRWDSTKMVFVTTFVYPTMDMIRKSDGVFLGTQPGSTSYYVQVTYIEGNSVYNWGPSKAYSAAQGYPSDSVIQSWINQNVKGALATSLVNYDSSGLGISPAIAVAAVKSHIEAYDFSVLQSFCSQHFDFGEMAVEAATNLRYVDENVLLILIDLIRLPELAQSLASLLSTGEWKAVKSAFLSLAEGKGTLRKFRRIAEPFANLYLSGKYGVAPNLGDLSKIGQGIANAMFQERSQRVHSRRTSTENLSNGGILSRTSVFTAEVNSFGERDWGMLQEFVYLGKRWGMYPEVQNLWDILMYSFVVDWFVQYGDFFSAIDAYLNTENYFPVKYCILSEKWEYTIGASELVPETYVSVAAGSATVSYYDRWITGVVPLPSVELSANTSLSEHWAEAGALVVQRRSFH